MEKLIFPHAIYFLIHFFIVIEQAGGKIVWLGYGIIMAVKRFPSH